MQNPDEASQEMAWIRRSLGGTGTGTPATFLARPSAERPELLLPLTTRAAAASSTRRYHDDRSARQRVLGAVAQLAGQAGLLARTGGETVELAPFALVERLQRALGEPTLIPAISAGPRRRNRKPVVQLLRPDGLTVGFAKVGWSGLTSELITNEASWLRIVDGRMPQGLRAPAVLWSGTASDGAGEPIHVVVTAPVRTSIASRRRFPLPQPDVLELASIADGGIHEVVSLNQVHEWRAGPLAALIDLDQFVNRHRGTTVGVGLWHGDLTPWNTATNGGVTSVWDWEFADRNRPVGFDLLHIEFELVRRGGQHREAAATRHVITSAASILEPLGYSAQQIDAIVDLYLLELLARETRLAGEGWQPEHLGQLDGHLVAALATRLTQEVGAGQLASGSADSELRRPHPSPSPD